VLDEPFGGDGRAVHQHDHHGLARGDQRAHQLQLPAWGLERSAVHVLAAGALGVRAQRVLPDDEHDGVHARGAGHRGPDLFVSDLADRARRDVVDA
jgi:hypothetical protein